MNELECIGCGVTIQSKDKDAIGYAPSSSSTRTEVYCQRCFKLRHYNKNESVSLDSDDFLQMVSTIHNTDSLVVHLIDIFDVDGTLLKNLLRIVGNNPIILVGNKVDLLPKSTNRSQLKNWVRGDTKEVGLKVIDVYLISSIKGIGLDELAIRMEKERNKKDIYVVGVTNVGKSTFINQFIQQSTGEKNAITTSYFPGTTLGFINIPLDDHSALIDTPGIVNPYQMSHYVSKDDLKIITPNKEIKYRNYQLNEKQTILLFINILLDDHSALIDISKILNPYQMAHYVSKDDLKIITPNKEIKSRNYQLDDGQTLFIGGLARFDFVKGEKQSFVCYFSNRIDIHRTKLENADALYERQLGELLLPPNEETLEQLPALVKNAYRIDQPNTDIVFPGLGWITILQGNITVEVYSPKGVAISIRKSFI